MEHTRVLCTNENSQAFSCSMLNSTGWMMILTCASYRQLKGKPALETEMRVLHDKMKKRAVLVLELHHL